MNYFSCQNGLMASEVSFQKVGAQWPEGLGGNHIGFGGKRSLPRKRGEWRRNHVDPSSRPYSALTVITQLAIQGKGNKTM